SGRKSARAWSPVDAHRLGDLELALMDPLEVLAQLLRVTADGVGVAVRAELALQVADGRVQLVDKRQRALRCRGRLGRRRRASGASPGLRWSGLHGHLHEYVSRPLGIAAAPSTICEIA